MPQYKIDKEQCMGCGVCAQTCPEGIEMNDEYKAEIIDQAKLAACGGKTVCPMGVIKEI